MRKKEAAENYYAKDFEWEDLKKDIEADPSLQHHFLPFHSTHPNVNVQEDNIHRINDKEDDSAEAWDQFHARHSTGKFFKERRYLLKEFPELASREDSLNVLEVGCGNGSTALPILRRKERITVYACDCSHDALERAKQIIDASSVDSPSHYFRPFLCDFATSQFPRWLACNSCRENFVQMQAICSSDAGSTCDEERNNVSSWSESSCCAGGVDFVTLIFTLSAVPLHRMPVALVECFSVLKLGGLLLFRDYAS